MPVRTSPQREGAPILGTLLIVPFLFFAAWVLIAQQRLDAPRPACTAAEPITQACTVTGTATVTEVDAYQHPADNDPVGVIAAAADEAYAMDVTVAYQGHGRIPNATVYFLDPSGTPPIRVKDTVTVTTWQGQPASVLDQGIVIYTDPGPDDDFREVVLFAIVSAVPALIGVGLVSAGLRGRRQ